MTKENDTKKCYIYTRVSTAMQTDGYSLDAQERKLHDYAEYNNLKIVGKYSDEGRSGKSVEGRPEFLRMMDDIEAHKDDDPAVYEQMTQIKEALAVIEDMKKEFIERIKANSTIWEDTKLAREENDV